MSNTLERPIVEPTYLSFFGLSRPPFARLSDPNQLFHSEQYSILMEHLANATTSNDSLVVVCGANGSGKTTLLNRFLTSVGDRTSCVTINETCHGEEQFYREFLTQIGFVDIVGTASELRNITKEFLVCRGIAGDHILIIIDNAHLADPVILEQLRRLCEIKLKDRRPLSLVLAGNADIVRVIDAPAMRQTKFTNHVVFSLRNFSEEETASYVWYRLKSAGANDGVKLPNETTSLIHRYSGGIPHLINTLGDEMLAEACSLESRVITDDIVRTVADKTHLLPHVVPFHGKGRRKTDPDWKSVRAVPETTGVDTESLLQQIAEYSRQLDDLRADKARALQDIDARNGDVVALRNELALQTTKVDQLTLSLANDADEIAQQNIALTESATALLDSELRSKTLAAELEQEILAREAALSELAEVTATVGEFEQLKQELQATIADYAQADLGAAEERATDAAANERNTEELKSEIERKTDDLNRLRNELASRNENLADLEMRLEESQAMFESAQLSIVALKNPQELEAFEEASDELAEELKTETRARKAAQKALAKSTKTVEALSKRSEELQAMVDDVQADLEVSLRAVDEHVAEIEAVNKDNAELNNEIEGKAAELDSLRAALASRNQDVIDLEKLLGETQQERASAQLQIATLKTPDELEEIAKASDRLTTELKLEKVAREAAEAAVQKATTTVEKLNQQKQELVAAVRDLNADLTVAGERAIEAYVLERDITDLKNDVEKVTRELESRNQILTDLEKQLEASQRENDLLRRRAPFVSADEDDSSREAATRSDSPFSPSGVVAKFEQSIRDIRAYKTLRKHDPTFYDSLIATYKKLAGQDLADKQIGDALRSKQVELIEQRLPRASDEAIIGYARLIVDQLDELQLEGIEPCLTLLVPKSNPDNESSPVFSDKTKERELDTLDITLRTYNANRKLPKEMDVWPDLGPIFSELFRAFGAENVAAIENSYDPNVDRILVCNVARALYSGVLNLPKRKAADALRWLLST